VYKCPYCGKELKEVNVVQLSAKKIAIAIVAGLGVAMIASSYLSPIGVAGGSILGLLVTLLILGRP
jgi:hypothetical protein